MIPLILLCIAAYGPWQWSFPWWIWAIAIFFSAVDLSRAGDS